LILSDFQKSHAVSFSEWVDDQIEILEDHFSLKPFFVKDEE